MVRKLILGLIGAVALSSCATLAAESEASSGVNLAIVGVTIIPMSEGSTSLADRTVLIRDGRIVSIQTGKVRLPASVRVIDGRGRYLMPGLVDAHVHLEYLEDPNVLKLFVANGVTSVRSMDGRPFMLDWRRQVEAGSLVGPRIVTAGPIIDGSPPARDDNLAAPDATAARAAVAAQAAAGYDFIKLYTNLSAEAYAAAVDEARQRKLPVAGHVPKPVPLATVIASQWSVEHLGDFAAAVAAQGGAPTPAWARRALGAPLDEARLELIARQLADAKIWVIPTTIQQDRALAPPAEVEKWSVEPAISQLPPGVLDQWRGMNARFAGRLDAEDWAMVDQARRNRLAVLGAFHRAGVRLAIGTDTPNPFVAMGASVHQELANFVAAGMTPAKALRAATAAPARMLALDREQGTVEVGKRADLLLLASNPFENVANAADRVGLILAGRWFSESDLKALAQDLARSQSKPAARP